MTDFERIDDYFAGRLSPVEREHFETALHDRFQLAESVAFYLLVRQIAQQEANRITKPLPVPGSTFRMVAAMAASLALILGLGWTLWIWNTPVSVTGLADQYITEHYSQFPLTLDGTTDSLKIGCQFYNQGNWKKAETVFESLLQHDANQPDVLKFAGIVSLQLRKYDQAIEHFQQLGRQTDLYSNPGVFLEALARLKRGQPMDKNRAKNLLLSVIQGNLEEKDEAEQLVERLKYP